MVKLTINNDACDALHLSHVVRCNEAILAFILGENSRNRQSRTATIEVLSVVGRLVVENFSIFFPENVWLGLPFNVTLESNCIAVAATQIL